MRVSGEAPQILSSLKKVTVYEGEDLELKCLVRGTPTPKLRWLFNDRALEPEGGAVRAVPTASAEFVESHVVVRAASKAAEGVYQCEASNVYGSGVAKFAKVSVVRRTRVEITSDEEYSVRAGQRLLMPCKVENDPLNRITNIAWTKDGAPIDIGPKDRIDFGMDGSLTVGDIQRRHEGTYRCTASTVLDNATDVVNVRVVVNAPVITGHSEDQGNKLWRRRRKGKVATRQAGKKAKAGANTCKTRNKF